MPALLSMLSVMLTAYLIARRRGYATAAFPGMRGVAASFVAALPGLLLVFVIFGGIRAGIFTAVESAPIAVLYAVLVTAARVSSAHVARVSRRMHRAPRIRPASSCS